MKALVCEMCGSQDLVKQDGMYVCQNCGTKYDPEEARKLLVEVKIDNSAKIQNLYQLARRAYKEGNYEDSANYYQQISIDMPDNWEANFYKVLCKQRCCMVKDLEYALTAVYNNISSTVSLILLNHDFTNEEVSKQITEVAVETMNFAITARFAVSDFLQKDYNSHGDSQYYSDYAKELCSKVERLYCLLLIKTAEIRIPEMKQTKLEAYQIAIESNNDVKARPQKFPDLFSDEEIQSFISEAKAIDPNFTPPAASHSNTSGGGGCYVATAVYGSYDCPQVWTLRRYRDYTLAETWYGRAFIKTYYAVSPSFVRWFGETEWFKNMWKPKLDKMVKDLNEKGVADTPYHDRIW